MGLTAFGVFHTVISLLAVVAGVTAFVKLQAAIAGAFLVFIAAVVPYRVDELRSAAQAL